MTTALTILSLIYIWVYPDHVVTDFKTMHKDLFPLTGFMKNLFQSVNMIMGNYLELKTLYITHLDSHKLKLMNFIIIHNQNIQTKHTLMNLP